MEGEDTVPLTETPAGQSPPDIVTHQPRATNGISTLSMLIKALLGEKESHGCYCLLNSYQRQESPQLASAFLIGTTGQLAGDQCSRSDPDYISRLKHHLTQQKVEIFAYKPKYSGSQADLQQLISNFFSRSDPSLFILYYSGPADDRGDWSISTRMVYGEEQKDIITLDTIVKKWKAAKPSTDSYLLIILDAPYSEKWVKKVKNYEAEANIIIMASSGSGGENPGDTQSLGLYTQSLVGSHGLGFYPRGAKEMIRKYLTRDPTSTHGLVCYVCGAFAYYK
jgi:hypothetical protein